MARQIVIALAILSMTAAAHAAAPPAPWTQEQKAKLAERDRLLMSLPKLIEAKEYDKAITVRRRITVLASEVLGELDPETASSYQQLAELYESLEKHADSVPVRREALRLQRMQLAEGHWMIIEARLDLERAQLIAAMTVEQRMELQLITASINRSARLFQQGKAKEAVELALQISAYFRRTFGEDHPDYSKSLNFLATLHKANGENAKALPYLLQSLRIRDKALSKEHPEYRATRNDLIRLYLALGEYAAALPLQQEVVREEKQIGERRANYATALSDLAYFHNATGDTEAAIPLYLKALEVFKHTLGEAHPHYAIVLGGLAAVHIARGDFAKALPQLREAHERHPNSPVHMNNLAHVYHRMGEYTKALPLFQQALRIHKKEQGEQHPHYMRCLNNIAMVLRDSGEYKEALSLLLEVQKLSKGTKSDRHPDYARFLNNLALLHQLNDDPESAVPLYREALAIQKQARAENSPGYLATLVGFAHLYRSAGEIEKAQTLLLEALEIYKKRSGERHPDYAAALNDLALVRQRAGKVKEAVEESAQALRILDRYLDDGFDRLGERQRNQILQDVLHNLSIHASLQEEAGQSASERYAPVILWKGRVAAYSALDRLMLDRPELKETLEKLQSIRTRLARLTLRTPTPAQQAVWLKQVAALSEQKEALEADLAQRSAEFRARKQLGSLSPEQVAKQLPGDVAFVDLIEYTHYMPPKGGKGASLIERRFLAFITQQSRGTVVVGLGPSKPIADAVARWREEVEKSPAKAEKRAIAQSVALLREKVWDKVAKHVGNARTIVVAPDGALCQFPLAALPGGKPGTYLIEEVAIAQVASAAQLFELLQPAEKYAKLSQGLLAIGGIDYGAGKTYRALPGTGPEAVRCRDLFRKTFADEKVSLLEGKEATPSALRMSLGERPKYLHLATHGYFEPADKVERLLRSSQRDDSRWQQQATLSNLPGLRCGLALSGANQVPPENDPEALPNVLTGQDLEGIDLRGCEMAVLSACQTALGDVTRSQGVLGLQRAFHAAGVRTTVTSLWSVQDAATAELMEEFYKRLWGKDKISRIEALRQAQIAILRDPERVRKRTATIVADAKKRGVYEELVQSRGIERFAVDVGDGDKSVDKKPTTSPEAWWAAFVLSGDWR